MASQAAEPPRQQQQQPQAAQEPQEGKQAWPGTTPQHCSEMVEKATTRNPMVKFMLDKMKEVRPAAAAVVLPAAAATATASGRRPRLCQASRPAAD